MSEIQLVRHCSPTLAGFKVGNMVNCTYQDAQELSNRLSLLNEQLNPKGVYIVLLRTKNNKALIYIYRPAKLMKYIENQKVQNFLLSLGYSNLTLKALLNNLRKRLYMQSFSREFPHEIGIFLGYPLEDVLGFWAYEGKNALLCGPWKVYGDVCKAQCLFAKHKKCTQVYCERLSLGTPISRLAVSI